ncbi:MAG TPA: hypothetical protein VIL85_03415 [Thermomicrobiales bacterium]
MAIGYPRCGRPFVVAAERLRVGYAVDIGDAACDCDLTEDEDEGLTDRVVAAFAGRAGGGARLGRLARPSRGMPGRP